MRITGSPRPERQADGNHQRWRHGVEFVSLEQAVVVADALEGVAHLDRHAVAVREMTEKSRNPRAAARQDDPVDPLRLARALEERERPLDADGEVLPDRTDDLPDVVARVILRLEEELLRLVAVDVHAPLDLLEEGVPGDRQVAREEGDFPTDDVEVRYECHDVHTEDRVAL